ncbi:MAG TPA: thioredoxin family protein [Bryobacteraceae bacterium]|nr:thioredoxin family protein [Bryobacteraceae bacterium]
MINNETRFENGHASRVVSTEEWLAARKQLLAKEKEFTRARDALNAERRKLPWVKVDQEYVFDAPEGKKTLAELFEGRSQLIVNHFMMGPGWKEGCVGCSFAADHIQGALVHLEHHDVSYVAVSRAPLAEIEPFKRRMGWKFRWVSSSGSDFNFDYHVSFTPEEIASGRIYYNYDLREARGEEGAGLSVFYKDDSGQIFHTYSSYGRGNEELLGTYVHLDITPKGRNENGPGFNLTDWVRHHDRYDHGGFVDRTGRYIGIAETA